MPWVRLVEINALGSNFDSAYISRKFPSNPNPFSLKTKKYLHRHPVDY
jgi:hypothetical protein